MRRKQSPKFRVNWLVVYVALIALLVIAAFAWIFNIMTNDTPWKRFTNYALVDKHLLDGATVLEQHEETVFIDESDDIHARLSPDRAKKITEQNVFARCAKSKKYCSNPSWVSPKKIPTVLPGYIPPEDPSDLLCTAAWNEWLDDNNTICVNTKTGDLWYKLDIH